MPSRLDKERQKELEPVRYRFAFNKLIALGFEPIEVSEHEIQFEFNGATVRLYPYSGWHTGKSIKDGRGINNLLKQLIFKTN